MKFVCFSLISFFCFLISAHSFAGDLGVGNGEFIGIDGRVDDVYDSGLPQKLRKVFDEYAKLDYLQEADRKKIDRIKGLTVVEEKIYLRYLLPKKFLMGLIRKVNPPDKRCGGVSYDMMVYIDPDDVELLIVRFTEPDVLCGIIIDYEDRKHGWKFDNWQDYPKYWL